MPRTKPHKVTGTTGDGIGPGTGTGSEAGTDKKRRAAVVMVHGMGEQRPLETLLNFADFVADPSPTERQRQTQKYVWGTHHSDDHVPAYFSRPTAHDDAFESRYIVIQGDKASQRDQLDVFEYHWAYKMQGNRFSDIFATTARVLFRFPWSVPYGLRGIWLITWAILTATVALCLKNEATLVKQFETEGLGMFLKAVIGATALGVTAGLAAASLGIIRWILKRIIKPKIVSHFVDVIRYLDTSPRSYAARKAIRKGMVDLLETLNQDERYDRVIVVAHSLGGYIAYDALTYYWTQVNQDFDRALDKEAIDELEKAAKPLMRIPWLAFKGHGNLLAQFREKQKRLWFAMRKAGNPWKVTDFISVGTPMYMADILFTKNREAFDDRVRKRHLATCPPRSDYASNVADVSDDPEFSYPHEIKGQDASGRKQHVESDVLYHAAPFSVVRWTNMWFPARLSFFGDWFGGPLANLFGYGIRDIPLKGAPWWRRFAPALAHAWYFTGANKKADAGSHEDESANGSEKSVRRHLLDALDLTFFRDAG